MKEAKEDDGSGKLQGSTMCDCFEVFLNKGEDLWKHGKIFACAKQTDMEKDLCKQGDNCP